MKENEWHYARTNSKGEKIFKRFTDESMDDAMTFLDEKMIPYEAKFGATMLWIYFDDKKYAYYPTTGRWNKYNYGGYPSKHYSAKGIKDFYYRFLLNDYTRTKNA